MHWSKITLKYFQSTSANLKIISPFSHAVAFRDLRLEHGHVGHGCSQTGDGLASTPSHSHKQGVASWLLQHTADPGQVLQEVTT